MPELTELSIVGTKWHATIKYDDDNIVERLTEFAANVPRATVIAAMKQQTPRLLICGSAQGIPQPKR
jgi:hypothetical protein